MLDWLFGFIGVCRKHLVRTGWDGALLGYICPSCARENGNYERWVTEEDAANPWR
jgi:hypothetical protein